MIGDREKVWGNKKLFFFKQTKSKTDTFVVVVVVVVVVVALYLLFGILWSIYNRVRFR